MEEKIFCGSVARALPVPVTERKKILTMISVS